MIKYKRRKIRDNRIKKFEWESAILKRKLI